MLKTPHLDRLAREGAMFRNAVSACPVCVLARTTMLTGNSMARTGVRNNAAAGDLEMDPGPTFDNILHARGYRSQYYGKCHAPYRMARTYDNKVAPVGVRTGEAASKKQEYLEYLDRHVPERPLRPGELLDPGSNRPYTPAILDLRYPASRRGERARQADVHGLLHIPPEHSRAAHVVDQCLRALEEMKAGPFSLTCSVDPPHPPMLNTAPYWGMYPAEEMPLPRNFRHDMSRSPYRHRAVTMTHYQIPEHIRAMISIYYGMVKEIDDNVGRLLRRLDELGLAGNTLVIFTSDHGEMLGSHGMHSKMVFYEESVHVPLLMRLPDAIKPGTAVDNPVRHADLFATILDYLGAAAPPREGHSLRPLLEGRPGGYPDYAVSEWAAGSPNFMVRTREWKLMAASRPDAKTLDALFNLKEDPYEMRNLLGEPQYLAQAEEMKERLAAWMKRRL